MNQKITELKHKYYMYAVIWMKYFTFKKFFNFLYNMYEYKTKKVVIKSVPFVVNIDVSTICVLNCRLCPTGLKDKLQTKQIITFEQFKPLFDEFKDYLFDIKLYNWGEPFLCKDIFKIVEYCHRNNVGVRIHSNLNYYTDEILENIVKSQIDYLHLSIDGYSQEAYEYYRGNGNIEKVFKGLEKIQEIKKRLKSKFPIIHWGYLINNKNKNEVHTASEYAKKLGVEIFEAFPMALYTALDDKYKKENYLNFLSEVKKENECSSRTHHGYCKFLWIQSVANPNGSFCPCTLIYNDSDNFGWLKKGFDVRKIHNSEIFTESRKIFKIKGYKPKCFTPCSRCESFEKPQ